MVQGNAEVQTVDLCGISEASKYVSNYGNESGRDEHLDIKIEENEQHNRNIFGTFGDKEDL